MIYRDSQSARTALYERANTQGGYVTTKQALQAGYTKQHLDYHVRSGNVERVERGLFRLPTVPVAEHDDLIRLSLWSRNRDDQPQAVVSHGSALALHELSDLLPGKVHLTVPRTFRKTAPSHCVLHRGDLEPEASAAREGFRVTTPLRTLLDVSDDDHVSTEQLLDAVTEAVERGLVRRSALQFAARALTPDARLRRVLEMRK